MKALEPQHITEEVVVKATTQPVVPPITEVPAACTETPPPKSANLVVDDPAPAPEEGKATDRVFDTLEQLEARIAELNTVCYDERTGKEYCDAICARDLQHQRDYPNESRSLARMTNIAATQMYQDVSARFVFELLQNCDDAHVPTRLDVTIKPQVRAMHRRAVTCTTSMWCWKSPVAVNSVALRMRRCKSFLMISVSSLRTTNVASPTRMYEALPILPIVTSKTSLTCTPATKGIGFKSVFSVCATPEIHSNALHFCFDSRVSLRMPKWVDSVSSKCFDLAKLFQERGMRTVVALPINHGTEAYSAQLLAPAFEDAILFLRQVRTLQVLDRKAGRRLAISIRSTPIATNAASGDFLEMMELVVVRAPLYQSDKDAWYYPDIRAEQTKIEAAKREGRAMDDGADEAMIQSADASEVRKAQWLAYKATLPYEPNTAIEPFWPPEVRSTGADITIAYPIPTSARNAAELAERPQRVYTTLPVASYGLTFAINCSCLNTTSARDSIIGPDSSPWNAFLLGKIPALAARAFLLMLDAGRDILTGKKDSTIVEAVVNAIPLLPLESKVDFSSTNAAPFRNIARETMAILSTEKWLPVAGTNQRESNERIAPCQALLVPQSLKKYVDEETAALVWDRRSVVLPDCIREIITPATLQIKTVDSAGLADVLACACQSWISEGTSGLGDVEAVKKHTWAKRVLQPQ